MTTKQNAEWLEAAKEHFQNAIDNEDVRLAKDIISDTFDAGFPEAAREMTAQLRTATTQTHD